MDQLDPCREWRGPRDKAGYGKITRQGKVRYVHRWIMQLAGHDIAGQVVMHLCDNPPCFRYSHLALGSTADNVRDSRQKGRGLEGERHHQAKLTEVQVAEIRTRYAAGGITQRTLAAEYGVRQGAISFIVRGQTWKNG